MASYQSRRIDSWQTERFVNVSHPYYYQQWRNHNRHSAATPAMSLYRAMLPVNIRKQLKAVCPSRHTWMHSFVNTSTESREACWEVHLN